MSIAAQRSFNTTNNYHQTYQAIIAKFISNRKEGREEEKKKLSDDAWAEVKSKVEQTKKELAQEVAKNQEENKALYEKNVQRLTEMYNANKEQWKKELVTRIISVLNISCWIRFAGRIFDIALCHSPYNSMLIHYSTFSVDMQTYLHGYGHILMKNVLLKVMKADYAN